MHKYWKYYLIGYVLALPGTLLGLLLCLWYLPKKVYFTSGCIELIPRSNRLIGGPWVAGQTFGNVIFYRDDFVRTHRPLRVHERVHVAQAMILTWPLFMVTYSTHFLWNLVKYRDHTWVYAYRRIWAEKQAYSLEHKTGNTVWGNEEL